MDSEETMKPATTEDKPAAKPRTPRKAAPRKNKEQAAAPAAESTPAPKPTRKPRTGKKEFERVGIAAHAKAVFGMFDGEEQNVRMRFAKYLAGAVIDRFGNEIIMAPDGDEHFTVNLKVVVSSQFYGWVFGFGVDAQILSPESVRKGMADALKGAAALYDAGV